MSVHRENLRDQDQAKITRNYTFLLSELNGELLADYLERKGVFNKDDKKEIYDLQSTETKVQLFLGKLLCSGPVHAFDVFLNALEEHYPHVAKKLRKTPQEEGARNTEGPQELQIPRNNEHNNLYTVEDKETLKKIRKVLAQNMSCMNILPVFHSYDIDVLSQQDIEEVTSAESQNGNTRGNHVLLNALVRYKGWYSCLLQALCDPVVHQRYLVDDIWKALGETRKDQTWNENDLVKNKVVTAVTRLEHMDDECLCSADGRECVMFVYQTFWKYSGNREVIGDFLADHRGAETCMKILRKELTDLKPHDDKMWADVFKHILGVCQNYSCESQKFVKRLADSGAVQDITNIVRQQQQQQREKETEVVRSLITVLGIIAAKVGKIPEYEDSKTVEVLMSLIRSTNENLRVHAMIVLAEIVGEDEKEKLTDTCDIVTSIIKFIRKAQDNQETRRYEAFTVTALSTCLARLAEIDANKQKIVAANALDVCLSILRNTSSDHKNDEQVWTATCLHNLAHDSSIRQTIMTLDGLVPALEDLRNSQHNNVKKWAGNALDVIKGQT